MSRTAGNSLANPVVVAVASWLLPGSGYWLLGQRARSLAVGISILSLFTLGLLIGGVRLLDVPGWGDHGQKLIVARESGWSRQTNQRVGIEVTTENQQPADPIGWVMAVHPMDEVRNKPWYIAQFMNGPINLLASYGSISAARSGAPRSHSRTNELGILYTAVAGMLNLLAIIDASHRAAHREAA